jgi:O-antigen ligase
MATASAPIPSALARQASARVPPWDLLRLGLGAALLTFVWRVQDLFPAVATIKPVMLTAAVVTVILIVDRTLFAGLQDALRHRMAHLTLVLLACCAISVPFSLWPGYSASDFLQNALPTIGLMLLVAAGIRTSLDARRVAAVQLIGAALYSTVILTRFDIGPNGRLGRLVYYDANDLGMLLDCTLPLAICFLYTASSLLRRGLVAAALLEFMVTIVKTGSRGAFLGFVAVMLYALFRFHFVRTSHRLSLTGVLAALLVATAGGTYWKSMKTLLHPTSDYNWIGRQEGGRMNVWKRGLGYMAARPLTGVGLGAFPVAEGTMSSMAGRQEYDVGVKWSAAHNSFVQIGAELGVTGLAAFVGLLLLSIRTARRAASAYWQADPPDVGGAALAEAHAASVIAFMVTGFFLSQGYAPYLYFVLGMILGLDRVTRWHGAS